MRHKMVNGVRVDFTPEEETARDAEELEATRTRTAEEINTEQEKIINSRWKDDPANDTLMLILYEMYKLASGTNPSKQAFWKNIKDRFKDETDNFFDF